MEKTFYDVVLAERMLSNDISSVIMEFRFKVKVDWPYIAKVGFSSLAPDRANAIIRQPHSVIRHAFDKDAKEDDIMKYFLEARKNHLEDEILSLKERIKNKEEELKRLESDISDDRMGMHACDGCE